MVILLVALGLVGGLTAWSVKEAVEPAYKAGMEKERLGVLKGKLASRRIGLDEAEDGAVLARRYGDGSEAGFRAAVSLLKRRRPRV